MSKKIVSTKKAPQAIGPYSQAVVVNNMVYTSGQIALNPDTGVMVEGGIEEQTRQVMENLKAVLAEAGASFTSAVKINIYLKDMNDFVKVNEIYGGFLNEPYPARATVEVSRLPKDALVEIDAIALSNKPA